MNERVEIVEVADSEPEPRPTAEGLVHKKTVGRYWVDVGGRTLVCVPSSKLRKQFVYPTADPSSVRRRVVAVEEVEVIDPVAVGDRVRLLEAEDGSGVVVEVLPRQNKLARRAAGRKRLEQVIVANVDQVVAMLAAARPAPKWALLDRYLSQVEALGLRALILITKLDLVDPAEIAGEVETYRRIGYPVILTSAATGIGLESAREALRDRVSVLIGSSGIGKTSLLNALQPGLDLRVREISRSTGKGRHTTSHVELFRLDFGGAVVDAPGMREFGLWAVQETELAETFPELRPHLGRCRFGSGCRHEREPGCAIKAAVERGEVSGRRYASYLRLEE